MVDEEEQKVDVPEAPAAAPAKGKGMWIGVVVVVIVIVVLLAAVFGGLFGRPAPTLGTVLIVGTTEQRETMDPSDAYNYFSVNFLQNTMATLLTYSETGDGTLAPYLLTEVPALANGGISSDGLTYTLRLRTDARFEDSTAINANIVKSSIDRAVKAKLDPVAGETRLSVPSFLLDPLKGANLYFTNFTGRVNDPANYTQAMVDDAWSKYSTQGVVVVDSTTVRIHMGRVWSPMVQLLAFTSLAPVNPNVFTMDAFLHDPTDISASGPYRVVSFTSSPARAELARNPEFFGTPARTPRVIILFYANSDALNLAMLAGEVDIAYRNLNPDDFNALKSDARFTTEDGASPVIRYIVFNQDVGELFVDARLRQALAMAVNRTKIVEDVFLNSVQELYSLVPAGMFGHKDAFLEEYGQRNIAQAQTLLTAAGYSTTNKLTFDFWFTPERYGTTESDVAQAIKLAWEETGMVSVTLRNQEWLTYRQSFRTGAFQAFLLGWFPDYLDADNYVFPFLHCGSGGTASFGSWYCNTALDTQIELQGQQTNPTQREQTLFAIQDTLAADVPYIPMWQTTQQIVYKKSVSGIVLDDSQLFRYWTLTITA